MHRPTLAIVFALLAPLVGGCALWNNTEQADYRTVAADPHHDSEKAQSENDAAIKLIAKGQPRRAESALQRALVADVTFAPAHNNLGALYFRQGKFYLAAWEFEYTRELMPDRPEPFNNLGMVYEAVGKLESAIEMYEIAYEMGPNNAEYVGNLARALLRNDVKDQRVAALVDDLRFLDTRPEWVAWANAELALGKLPRPPKAKVSPLPPPASRLETLPIPLSPRPIENAWGGETDLGPPPTQYLPPRPFPYGNTPPPAYQPPSIMAMRPPIPPPPIPVGRK